MIEAFYLKSQQGHGVHRAAVSFAVFYLWVSCCSPAFSEEQPLVNLGQTAQIAFEQGKFKKAVSTWSATIHGLEDNGQKDSFLELCLKRLGQSYMRLEKCLDAYQALTRARDMCLALGLQDDELQNELLQLSKVYRSIEPSELGEGTAKALQRANVTSVSLLKTGDSSKMQVDLPERFEKPVEDNSIDSLAFDKQVTLDVEELADGTVLLKNIRGLKLHAKEYKMWVNLLEATIKPEDPNGAYPAEVTAGKMGVTKTVAAVLPHRGFEPLAGILKQLRAMSMPQTLVTSQPAIKLEPSEKLEPSTKPEPSTKLEPSTTLEPFLPITLLRHPVIHKYGDVCIFVCDH